MKNAQGLRIILTYYEIWKEYFVEYSLKGGF